ncbi:MAG: hypothetical protein ACRDLT_06735 [Solirubrobacteraceae bacterium]
MELVMDGAYATKAWQGLPDRASVTTRMRANAAVFKLTPARTGRRGRPALKGHRLASLAEIAETETFTAVSICGPDGRQPTAHIHQFVCLWYTPFHTRPIKVILIRNPGSTDGFDITLASTDTLADDAALIARYDSRWTIETCHQEAKANGVGQARNRVQKAVERTVPFRLPMPDAHDRLVPAPRQPRPRRSRPPPPRTLVPAQADRQLQRHARRATPRADPRRISRTSTPPNPHTTNQTTPITVSTHRRVRPRKSSDKHFARHTAASVT